MNISKKNILFNYRRYTFFIVLILSMVGLALDIMQEWRVIEFWTTRFFDNSNYVQDITPRFSKHINLTLLNLITISIYLVILLFIIQKRIDIIPGAIIYSLSLSFNIYLAYYWYFTDTIDLSLYVLRDFLVFHILIFTVSTCTNTFMTILITILATGFYVIAAIKLKNNFLIENIPLAIMLTTSYAYVFRKIINLLDTSIRKQEEEASSIQQLSLFKEKMSNMLLHDIKVPMNSISMLSNSKSSASNYKKINYQAAKVSRMLSNIIDVESGNILKIKLAEINFLLSDFITEAVNQIHYFALEKNISLHKNQEESNILVYGDRNLLERCLINIIDNAIKYSPAHSTIEINAIRKNGKIWISVIDQGPGIRSEEKEKIFELFYTSEETQIKEGSSGIGLTFCKMVVDAHQGNIIVLSNDSGGTNFTFSVPQSKNAENYISDSSNEIKQETLQLIQPYTNKLKKIRYYETTEILNVLNELPNFTDENTLKDIELFKEIALSCNNKKYNKLIATIK